MKIKLLTLVLVFTISVMIISGCGQPTEAQEKSPHPQIDLEEAHRIAEQSACTDVGPLSDDAFYNDVTNTWWIDIETTKEGCAPACVVAVATSTSEINWRCTGAIPPKEKSPETDDPTPTLTTEPEPQSENVDAIWNQYTNPTLGFSINVPKEIAIPFAGCVTEEIDGKTYYRPQFGVVPTVVFEDGDAVYITFANYHSLEGETPRTQTDGGTRIYYTDCIPVDNTLNC